MDVREVELKVAEAMQNDVSRGIVRLDTKTRDMLGISTGDIIEMRGKRVTGAIVWRAYAEDEGLGIIRMDGILRQNAEVSLGDKVNVKKATAPDAKRVVLAPTQAIRFSTGFGDFVKRRLLGRPVAAGDRTVVGVLGTTLPFTVSQTTPAGITRIADHTEIVVKEEPMKTEKAGIPRVSYEDIGGLKDEIMKIREMIELPLKHPELFVRLGIEPPKGVLLHGPPGTGKTLIAKAVANETNAYFISLNGPEIMSKFYGESEENLRRMFKEGEENAPSIIFIDEIDAIAPKREEAHGEVERRVVAQLLALMDGLKGRGKVVVIGATNRPEALDSALRRPGRFDREIVIGVPDRDGRKEILQIHTRGMPLSAELYPGVVHEFLKLKIDEKIYKLKLDKKESDGKMLEELSKLKESMSKPKESKHYKILGLQEGASNEEIKNAYWKKAKECHPDMKPPEKKKEAEEEFKKLTKAYDALSDVKNEGQIGVLIRFIIENEGKLSQRESYDSRNEFYRAQIKGDTPEIIQLAVNTGLISPEELAEMKTSKEAVDVLLNEFADITHGFVGADMEALCKEAAMVALRKILPEMDLKDETIAPEILEKLEVVKADFVEALKLVEPSALREVFVEIPNVRWEDVGGLEEVKRELIESVEWPIKYPNAFKSMGIRPPKGVLIFGPPGCGKTLLAKAVANESEANFISVKGPEVLSKWVGESEKAMRQIFKKAKQAAPTVIFFDEIDAITSQRGLEEGARVGEKVLNQLLTEMDGVEELNKVVVIAATNRPDMLDAAILRPGRLDRLLLVPVPDEEARRAIFKVHTKNMPLDPSVDLDRLAKQTDGYVGADIEALCREAGMLAIRETLAEGGEIEKKKVAWQHFSEAMKKVKPSVNKDVMTTYERLLKRFETKEMERPDLVYTR